MGIGLAEFRGLWLVAGVAALGCNFLKDSGPDPGDYPGAPYPRIQLLVADGRVAVGQPVAVTVVVQCADPCPLRVPPDAGTGRTPGGGTHCLSVSVEAPARLVLPVLPDEDPAAPRDIAPPARSTWYVRADAVGHVAVLATLTEGACDGARAIVASTAGVVLEFVSTEPETGSGGADADDDADTAGPEETADGALADDGEDGTDDDIGLEVEVDEDADA